MRFVIVGLQLSRDYNLLGKVACAVAGRDVDVDGQQAPVRRSDWSGLRGVKQIICS